jgi:hypothetical protein
MKTVIFEYKSTGVKHKEENQFFEFVVKNRFREQNNRSLQWCTFEGLKIILDTLEPAIIGFVKLTLVDVIETNNGHKWELNK